MQEQKAYCQGYVDCILILSRRFTDNFSAWMEEENRNIKIENKGSEFGNGIYCFNTCYTIN